MSIKAISTEQSTKVVHYLWLVRLQKQRAAVQLFSRFSIVPLRFDSGAK
jgi:hypothetical protein